MAEYSFKTQVIFHVEAESEEAALHILQNAIGEPLTTYGLREAIRFNTMSKLESLQPKRTSEERRALINDLYRRYKIGS